MDMNGYNGYEIDVGSGTPNCLSISATVSELWRKFCSLPPPTWARINPRRVRPFSITQPARGVEGWYAPPPRRLTPGPPRNTKFGGYVAPPEFSVLCEFHARRTIFRGFGWSECQKFAAQGMLTGNSFWPIPFNQIKITQN